MNVLNNEFHRLVHDGSGAPTEGTLPAASVRDPALVRDAILRAIAQINARLSRGGTLYVPPVPGGELWIDVSSALVIPENITLAVAPGVVLIPVVQGVSFASDGQALEISGLLRCPVGQVFAVEPGFRGPGTEGYALARVRLTGELQDRVHPEWWGTSHPDEALAAAVRAALADRHRTVSGERRWLSPLALELR